MPQKKTPESLPPKKERLPKEPAYLKNAEGIREALGISDDAETPERWKSFLDLINTQLKSPEESTMRGLVRQELDRQYTTLMKEREDLAKALLAVLSFVENKKKLTPVYREAVLRSLARFIDKRALYNHIWEGTVPSGTELPEYLVSYIETSENERFAIRTSEFILPIQYDVLEDAKIDASPRILAPQANEIVVRAVRRRMRMQYVLSCLNEGGTLSASNEPFEQFMQAAGYQSFSQEDINAARLLIGYIAKNKKKIDDYVSISGNPIESLTIADALECCANVSIAGEFIKEIAIRAPGILEGRMPDLRSFTKKVLENKDLYPERMIQVVLAPLTKLGSQSSDEERKHFQRDAKVVANFLLGFESGRVRTELIKDHISHLNNAQKEMILALCGVEMLAKMKEDVLAAAFIPKEASDRGKLDVEIAEAITSLFDQKKITAREAFQIFYLSSSDAGTIPLLFKIIQILDNHGYSNLATELQARSFRKFIDISRSKVSELDADLSRFNLSDEQRREMQNIRKYFIESGLDVMGRYFYKLWIWAKNFPEISIPVGILAGIPVGKGIHKVWVKCSLTRAEKFASMGVAQAKDTYKLAHVSDEIIKAGQEQMLKLLGEHDRLVNRWHLLRARKLRGETKLIMRAAKTGEIEEMAKALKKAYPHPRDLARQLSSITTDQEQLRSALKAAGLSDADINDAIRSLPEPTIDVVELRKALPSNVDDVPAAARAKLFDMPEAKVRFDIAKRALHQIGYVEDLTDVQKLAILRAHDIPPSLPLGQKGLWSAIYSVEDLGKKADILREAFPNSPHWKAILRSGAAGEDVATLTKKLSDTALSETGRMARTAEGAVSITPEALRSRAALSRLLQDKKFIDLLKNSKVGVKTAEDAAVFLELAQRTGKIELDTKTIALIEQSGRARKFLAGAISTGKVKEVARVMEAARLARNTRIGLNVIGAAGDVFGIYMAYCDWQLNKERIANTSNPALIELYQYANYIYAAEAGGSAVGLVVGGYVIIKASAAGEGVLGALGASGGLIMIPIAVAVVGGGLYYRELENAAEGWLKTEKDWKKQTEGDLMGEYLQNSQPGVVGKGFFGNFDGRGVAHATRFEDFIKARQLGDEEYKQWTEKGIRTVEGGNLNKRYEIMPALIAHMTHLPRTGDESEEHYKKRLDQYISDQFKYLIASSQNDLDITLMSWFEDAKMHAEMKAYGRALRAAGLEGIIEWEGAKGERQSYDLAQYGERGIELKKRPTGLRSAFRKQMYLKEKVEQLNSITKIYGGDKERLQHISVQQELLLAVRPYVAKLEGEILRQDFEGILIWDDSAKAAARYTLAERLVQVLEQETDKLVKKKEITVEDFDKAIGNVQKFLQSPAKSPDLKGYVVNLTNEEKDTAREYPALGLQWMSQAFAKDLPNLEYYRQNPHKAVGKVSIPSLVDRIKSREYKRSGNKQLVYMPPRSGPSEVMLQRAAYYKGALSIKPKGWKDLITESRSKGAPDKYKKIEKDDAVINFDSLGLKNIYFNRKLDPNGLYYVERVKHIEQPKEDGIHIPPPTVLHRLTADGNDAVYSEVLPEFLSSKDFSERDRNLMLLTLATYHRGMRCKEDVYWKYKVEGEDERRKLGTEYLRIVDVALDLFPYEIRDGVNYRDELRDEILRKHNPLVNFEEYLQFTKNLVVALNKHGGCTKLANEKILEDLIINSRRIGDAGPHWPPGYHFD